MAGGRGHSHQVSQVALEDSHVAQTVLTEDRSPRPEAARCLRGPRQANGLCVRRLFLKAHSKGQNTYFVIWYLHALPTHKNYSWCMDFLPFSFSFLPVIALVGGGRGALLDALTLDLAADSAAPWACTQLTAHLPLPHRLPFLMSEGHSTAYNGPEHILEGESVSLQGLQS